MNVIFRPHPQLYVDIPKQMEEIEKELSTYPNLSIDKAPSGDKSMAMADILISDISGIIFDFAFIYQKPIVLFSSDVDIGGLEAEDVDFEVWEFGIFDKIAYVVSDNDDIVEVVKSELNSHTKKDLDIIKSNSLFNFANAGKTGANQLKDLLSNYTKDM